MPDVRINDRNQLEAMCRLVALGRPPRRAAGGREEFVEVPSDLIDQLSRLMRSGEPLREANTHGRPAERLVKPTIGLFWAATVWVMADLAIRTFWL